MKCLMKSGGQRPTGETGWRDDRRDGRIARQFTRGCVIECGWMPCLLALLTVAHRLMQMHRYVTSLHSGRAPPQAGRRGGEAKFRGGGFLFFRNELPTWPDFTTSFRNELPALQNPISIAPYCTVRACWLFLIIYWVQAA